MENVIELREKAMLIAEKYHKAYKILML